MVASTTNYRDIYKMMKGHIKTGGLNMMWDFTGGLTEHQWLEARERALTGTLWDEEHPMIVTNSGRIIMPSLGII